MVLVPINNHAFGLFNMHNSWTIFYLLIMQHYFNFYMDYNLYTQSIFFLFTMQTRLFFFFFLYFIYLILIRILYLFHILALHDFNIQSIY
jgi:hypothetical protein